MSALVAVLAAVVASLYLLIAGVVVPQLARVAMHGSRSIGIVVAAAGAGTFFVGCAVTHLAIAYRELDGNDMHRAHGTADLFGHVVPHLAQIIGGVAFIVLARRRLDVRIVRRDDSARVEELEGRLRHALDAGGLGAWETNLQTGATWHSSQHDRIFGYDRPPEQWSMETMLDHVVPSQRNQVREQLALTPEAPTVALECEIVWDDGAVHWIAISGALQLDEHGDPLRVIGTVSDITERRLREQQRIALEAQLHHWQRAEAVGRLASGVAHDFNNVLTAVNGWADLITLEAAADDEIKDHARAITAAADHGRRLTGQLLSIGREQTAGTTVVDVNEIAGNAVAMLQRLIDQNIQVRADLQAVAPIRIDPTHLSQILINLAINARDAMPGGGDITVATTHTDESARQVAITVRDTGSGIDNDAMAHLFEPYFTTKQAGSGTGLGLSIVETLVQRASGRIAVESAPGQGAAFTITFPAAHV